MSSISSDFKKLLPKEDVTKDPWKGPLYWLWVFDPMTGNVILEHNKDRHPAEWVTHHDMAPEVVHPERQHGYVYRIQKGYRITTNKHKPLDDPFIKRKVEEALRKENPPKALPKIK